MAVKKAKKTAKKKTIKKVKPSERVEDSKPKEEGAIIGRPTKFNEAVKIAIGSMTDDGFTNKEICERLKIDEQTYYNWKKTHRAFFESLSDWKKSATYRIEETLFHSCMEKTVKETKPVVIAVGDGMSTVEYHDYEKYIPANVTAQKYWLNNRSNDWRDKREHEIKEVQSMDDAELKAKVAAILAKGKED